MSRASWVALYAAAVPSMSPNCFSAEALTRPVGPALLKTPARMVASGCAAMAVLLTSFFEYSRACFSPMRGKIVPPFRPPFGIFFLSGAPPTVFCCAVFCFSASAIRGYLLGLNRGEQLLQALAIRLRKISVLLFPDGLGSFHLVQQHRHD